MSLKRNPDLWPQSLPSSNHMILLFTDYGAADIYSGQLRAAIWSHEPGVDIVDLLHTAPNFNIKASAHLLAALVPQFQAACVCLAIVDPGVGSLRDAVVMLADDKWYIGPDNGLLSVVAARARKVELWRIIWRPENLSRSFHGRDLFAPIAAQIGKGIFPHGKLAGTVMLQVEFDASDLAEIIYIDHYGNAMTGLRAGAMAHDEKLRLRSVVLPYAPVFSESTSAQPFWYENSIGLIEIALNRGHAAALLGLEIGDMVQPCTRGLSDL
ncbi:MAG: SAM-dependent chlorinase/fluorinase [Sulfuricella sp.]|nr:SAM-dependent chlorinase/fluorinase [Sulfuricella sp.]